MPESKKERWNELYEIADSAFASGTSSDKLAEILLKVCDDEPLVYAVIKKVKADHYEKHLNEGLVIIAIGAAFIVAGFIITCFNFHENKSVSFAMYGLTTIGIAIMFWGLYKIIG